MNKAEEELGKQYIILMTFGTIVRIVVWIGLHIQKIMGKIGFAGVVILKKTNGICKMSSEHANNYNAVRKIYKDLRSQKREIDPAEQFFDDDPDAEKEIEYGKIQKNITHVETRTVLDEF